MGHSRHRDFKKKNKQKASDTAGFVTLTIYKPEKVTQDNTVTG